MPNNSASYVDTTTIDGINRASILGVNKTKSSVNTTTLAGIQAASGVDYTLSSTDTANVTTKRATTATEGVIEPKNYKWNLPPHTWSLPVRPVENEPSATSYNTSSTFHNLRRGRLWFWSGAEDINAYADDGSVTTIGAKADAKKATKTGVAGESISLADTNYGFQFLWNPSTISSSVARNMDITPSHADRLKIVAGAFPGQETVSFNIVIDRINDFACLKASLNPSSLVGYYGTGYPSESDDPVASKIDRLMRQGTMADLEYLFKAINGGFAWKTLLGKETANIGFLMPTLLGLVLGPDVTNSLSYVGWLTGITMQHEMFTQDMIPLRTTVSINMECFAGSGLVSS